MSVKPIEIIGLLDPIGVGGMRGAGPQWSLIVILVNWKYPGGPLQNSALRLEKFVPYEEIDTYRESIQHVTPYRFKIWVAVHDTSPKKASLDKVLGVSDDPELVALANELRQPVLLDDAQFGTFTLDRAYDGFHCDTPWDGEAITLTLSLRGGEGADGCLSTAKALWEGQRAWSERIRSFCAERLLTLKNENWLRDDEAGPLSAAQFAASLTLTSIVVEPGGSFTFWYDDGGLFSGHGVWVEGSLERGPTQARMG